MTASTTMRCGDCGHEWVYDGRLAHPNCPRCNAWYHTNEVLSGQNT